MGGYTYSPDDANAAEGKKLWNPSKTLGIINTDPGYQCITCIGYAPSQGRRCRNPIRRDNREFIMDTLEDIAYLHPDNPAVMSQLRTIAGPALCVRYHQNQAERVVMEWQRKLQQLKPVKEERRSTKPSRSRNEPEPSQDERIKDLQKQLQEMMDLLAQLKGEANSQQHQDDRYERRDKKKEEGERDSRKEKECLEKERLYKERLEQERLEQERLEQERLEQERLEKERLEKERLEKERLKKERLEKERLDKERSAKQRKEQEEKRRREREQQKREREQKERQEWDQLWTNYQDQWVHFKASVSSETNVLDAIPWPVKTGSYRDAKASNVKEFFRNAVPRDASMSKLMRKECQKWHPDIIYRLLRDCEVTLVVRMMIDMICRVVTELLDNSSGKSAEFLG
ncbi:hypothetical protein BP6252_06000 [Coleophoma cylindrospora]|uniref:Uncharacterized protein n=1 Tax=Coleophoma cylindrospora TaxID=1849047 RepID=A0A3D8RLL9_9HELO|nr:hypothetical protein BP6252_06000 [Coleophoma cylindrospora]